MNVLGKIPKSTKRFLISIEKEVTNTDEDGNESVVIISYKIKFIKSAKLMASSLSNLIDNLAEGIHKIKSKDCDCFPEYESLKYNTLSFHKDYLNKVDEKLKKRFKNTFKFSYNEIDQFILLLRKSVYPYDDWMIGKSLIKQHYLKKKNFVGT